MTKAREVKLSEIAPELAKKCRKAVQRDFAFFFKVNRFFHGKKIGFFYRSISGEVSLLFFPNAKVTEKEALKMLENFLNSLEE